MTHLTETEAEKVGADVIPEDIFQTACGIVMEAKSLKSMLKHKDVVDAIALAILAERERSQWKPIETAPRDGQPIDLWGVNHLHHAKTGRRATNVTFGPVRDWMGNERNDWQHGHGEDFEPTHWMRRPAAPKSEG